MLTRINSKPGRLILTTAFLLLVLLGMQWANHNLDKAQLVSTEGRTFEMAKVVEVQQDNLLPDGSRMGNQVLLLKMASGPLRGQEVEATSANGHLFGAVCKPGMRVVVISSVYGDISINSVYSVDRGIPIACFALLFILALCLVGGKSGAKSAVALIFTLLCIFMLFMPMIYRGFSPFICAMAVCAVTTIATMYLVGGASRKTASAILGTVFGVLVAGIAAAVFGYFAGLGGYNVSNIESLIFVAQGSRIQIGGLLFSGILIASLGAVMDVAMSISSAISEIHAQNPLLGRYALFKCGMNVGRDMMGTMSNTLILAFVGGSLGNLVLNYAYDLPLLQLLNSNSIGIEIMQGLSGSLGIILTVPMVSGIASLLLGAVKVENSSPAAIPPGTALAAE